MTLIISSQIATTIYNFLINAFNIPELWEHDLTNDITIGPTTEGYKNVDLRCSAESMQIDVEMENDFSGVLYIKGSYSSKKFPCFLDVNSGTKFNMKIPFNQCNIENKNGLYQGVLIIQHDDELIMPGDATFNLECDFSKPKDIPVHSSVLTEIFDVISRITLADPDPSPKDIPKSQRLFVANRSNVVSFRPKLLRIERDEL
ncbi:hypothetical protein O3M35_010504 [Rhynocoris fuscipes]|uniref:ZP domain-containing protein n=1 Tax=Rhynocoris fuscipes TaxID=488301 RepID=A0AAW1D0G5_9HEMI